MKFSGVMVGSEDSKKLGEFYAKVFGELSWHQDDWYGFGEMSSGLVIGSHSEVKGKNEMPQRLMINFSVDDTKAEFERIKELGAEVIAEPYQPDTSQPDMWIATFADPDGNYFQIAPAWTDSSESK